MRIVLSNHARMRAQMRDITFEEIIDCITNPDQISEEEDQKLCYKKLTNQDRQILLCYTIEDDGSILVITVIKTSKVSKYFQ